MGRNIPADEDEENRFTDKRTSEDHVSSSSSKGAKQEASIQTEKQTEHGSHSNVRMNFDPNILSLPYQDEILLGIIFIASPARLEIPHKPPRAVIFGLRLGILPMYLRKNLPSVEILVIESDPTLLDDARYFGFEEYHDLKLCISDGLKAINKLPGIWWRSDILIVDVDSTDPSSGLTCPGEGYVKYLFLSRAESVLSEDGMLIMNLLCEDSRLKEKVYKRLKKIFSSIFIVDVERGESEVIFAMKKEVSMEELMQNSKASIEYAVDIGFSPGWGVTDLVKKIY